MFKAIKRTLQALATDIARESAAWKIRCTTCGHQRSLQAAGGIRYKAFGETHTLAFCSKCKSLRIVKIYRPPPSASNPSE